MPDEHADPSATTDQFRAFVADSTPESKPSRTPIIVAAVVAAILVIAVVAWMVS
jgi:fatty acid desaturase